MLFINYKGNTPQQRFYTIGVQDNNKSNRITFIIEQQQSDLVLDDEGYKPYIKVCNRESGYFDKITPTEYNFVDGNCEIVWNIEKKSTQYRNLEVQIVFEEMGGDVVWQTLIVELEFGGTIKADEEIEKEYPSILQDLEKEIDDLDENKQDKLVSGENIKTINNQSILGSGNITIEGADVPTFTPTYWSGDEITFREQDLEDIITNKYQKIAVYSEDDEVNYYFDIHSVSSWDNNVALHYSTSNNGDDYVDLRNLYIEKINSTFRVFIYHLSFLPNNYVNLSSAQTITGVKTFVNPIKLANNNTDTDPIILAKMGQKFAVFYGSLSTKLLEANASHLDTTNLEPMGTNSNYNIGRNTNLKRYNYVYCKSVDANSSVETPTLYTTNIVKESNDGEYPYFYLSQDSIRIGNGNDGDLLYFNFGSNVIQKSIYPVENNSVNLGKSTNILKNVYTNKIANDSKEIEIGDLSTHHTYTPTSYDFASQSITFTTEQLTDIWDRDLDEINIVFGSDTYTYKKVNSWTDGSSYELVYECFYKPQSHNYTIHSAIYLMFDGSSYSYGFMYKTLNPQTSYYTKAETDNIIATLKQNSFQDVDTTTYPTLNDFLTSTGEEGYIYLYPIDTSDLTKGYHRYTWESSSWRFLGNTNLVLTNYVDLTSAQEISGAKTFTTAVLMKNNVGVKYANSYSNGFTISNDGSGGLLFKNNYNVAKYHFTDSNFYPDVSGAGNLGTSAKPWGDFYLIGAINKNASNYGLTLPDTTGFTANKTIATTDQITKQWYGTQAEYDALGTYDSNTIYNILES